MSDRRPSHTVVWVFVVPLLILVVLPPVCWCVVHFTQGPAGIESDSMYMLGAMFVLWAELPACIFRQPLFAPEDFGYGLRGVLGWLVIIAFWIVISLSISFTARYSARRRDI